MWVKRVKYTIVFVVLAHFLRLYLVLIEPSPNYKNITCSTYIRLKTAVKKFFLFFVTIKPLLKFFYTHLIAKLRSCFKNFFC